MARKKYEDKSLRLLKVESKKGLRILAATLLDEGELWEMENVLKYLNKHATSGGTSSDHMVFVPLINDLYGIGLQFYWVSPEYNRFAQQLPSEAATEDDFLLTEQTDFGQQIKMVCFQGHYERLIELPEGINSRTETQV